jgi:hypothetical protein
MEKNEKMKGSLGEWLEKSGKMMEVFRVKRLASASTTSADN